MAASNGEETTAGIDHPGGPAGSGDNPVPDRVRSGDPASSPQHEPRSHGDLYHRGLAELPDGEGPGLHARPFLFATGSHISRPDVLTYRVFTKDPRSLFELFRVIAPQTDQWRRGHLETRLHRQIRPNQRLKVDLNRSFVLKW